MDLYPLLWFIALVAAYHLFRYGCYYVIKKVIVDLVDGEVEFTPGNGFLSLQYISVKNDNGTAKIKYFKQHRDARGTMEFAHVRTNFSSKYVVELLKKMIGYIRVQKSESTSVTFHIKDFVLENELETIKVNDLTIKSERTMISVTASELKGKFGKFDITIPKFEIILHYFKNRPTKCHIVKPKSKLEFDGNRLHGEFETFYAHSDGTPVWRLEVTAFSYILVIKDAEFPKCVVDIVLKDICTIIFSDVITFKFQSIIGSTERREISFQIDNMQTDLQNFKVSSVVSEMKAQFIPFGLFFINRIPSFKINQFKCKIHQEDTTHSCSIDDFVRDVSKYASTYAYYSMVINDTKSLEVISTEAKYANNTIKAAKFDIISPIGETVSDDIFSINYFLDQESSQSLSFVVSDFKAGEWSANDVRARFSPRKRSADTAMMAMVASVFPNLFEADTEAEVFAVDMHVVSAHLVGQDSEFTKLKTDGIIYLVKPERGAAEVCGMLDVTSKVAAMKFDPHQTPRSWVVNFDLGELGLKYGSLAITATDAVGDFTETKFQSFRTAGGYSGAEGEVRLTGDRRILKVAELKSDSDSYIRAVVEIDDTDINFIAAERVQTKYGRAINYEYDLKRRRLKAASAEIKHAALTDGSLNEIVDYAEIGELYAGPLTLQGVTYGNNKFSSDLATFRFELFSGTISNVEIERDSDSISMHGDTLDAEYSLMYNLKNILNALAGYQCALFISSLRVRLFSAGEKPSELVETRHLKIRTGATKELFSVSVMADSLDISDVRNGRTLLMFVTPGNAAVMAEAVVEGESLQRCGAYVRDVIVNTNARNMMALKRVLSPLFVGNDAPPFMKKRLRINDFTMGEIGVSLTYDDPHSDIFSGDRLFQFILPKFVIKKSNEPIEMTAQELIDHVSKARQVEGVNAVKSIVNEDTEATQTNSGSAQIKGIFSFLQK